MLDIGNSAALAFMFFSMGIFAHTALGNVLYILKDQALRHEKFLKKIEHKKDSDEPVPPHIQKDWNMAKQLTAGMIMSRKILTGAFGMSIIMTVLNLISLIIKIISYIK